MSTKLPTEPVWVEQEHENQWADWLASLVDLDIAVYATEPASHLMVFKDHEGYEYAKLDYSVSPRKVYINEERYNATR